MVCIFVASKLHDRQPILMAELKSLAAGTYIEEDVRRIEMKVLESLGWDMNPVVAHHIMRHLMNLVSAEYRWELLEHAEGKSYCFLGLNPQMPPCVL